MAAGSAGDGNLARTSFQPPTKSVPIDSYCSITNQSHLSCDKSRSNCCKLLLKGRGEDKEEIQETIASLAAHEEMSTDAAVAVVYQKWKVFSPQVGDMQLMSPHVPIVGLEL